MSGGARKANIMFDRYGQFTLFDGGMGTELQKRGLKPGGLPELFNITNPDIVLDIHRAYVNAGADVVTANTFGANALKFNGEHSVAEIISAGIALVKKSGAKYAALDLGPTGAMLKPIGTMTFSECYELYKEQVIAGVKAGADIALIETMSDMLEAKAALLAVKENSDLPVFVTMTFGEDGRTFLGTPPKAAAVTLSSLGADAVGINCSLGPEQTEPFIDEMLEYSPVPVMAQPNAGLPVIGANGETRYDVTPEEFASVLARFLDKGVTIAGGCCGTTPEHIRLLRREMDKRTPHERVYIPATYITSAQRIVAVRGKTVAVIGERINPTGKKKVKEALRTGNHEYILNEAISQEEAGADILDVNAGLPEIDEPTVLEGLVTELQSVTPLPLQIDSSDTVALERACRVYCGKPIINSVNGKKESLETVLPIAKKYGAAVVGLALDENGIPESAEERFKIASRIIDTAASYGIPKNDVLIDCLVTTISTNQSLAVETLKAVSMVTERLGVGTVLGVSNVSFGLPAREIINSTFLAEALAHGLSMPILNPMSKASMDVISAHRAISGSDAGALGFIEKYADVKNTPAQPKARENGAADIKSIVLSGRTGEIESAVRDALDKYSAMDVINKELIPAIDAAGDKFASGEFFLPQLMLSAETVQRGFEVVRGTFKNESVESRGTILLATVKGDIHDIGKNIVKLLLVNYGYEVVDLGKDVPPEEVVRVTMERDIKLVGLSALMTTTVRSMGDTIKALKAAGSDAKVMVGGAVLNEEYAALVGADYYAKDAAESAKIAGIVFGK